jgi:hypothetical protein
MKEPRSDPTGFTRQYHEDLNAFFINRIRLGTIWASIFYPLFILLDYTVYPEHFQTFLYLRITVEIILILALVMLISKFGKKNAQYIAMVEYAAICFSIIAMIHFFEGYASPYYAGIILSLLFLQSIAPLSFRRNLVITLVVLAGYLLPIVL